MQAQIKRHQEIHPRTQRTHPILQPKKKKVPKTKRPTLLKTEGISKNQQKSIDRFPKKKKAIQNAHKIVV